MIIMMVRMRGSEVYLRPTAFRLDKYKNWKYKKFWQVKPCLCCVFPHLGLGSSHWISSISGANLMTCQDGWIILAFKIIVIVTVMMMMMLVVTMVVMMMVFYKVLAYLNMSIYLALRRLRASIPRAKIIKGSL